MNRRITNQGFTLIEVVVSIAILGLISTTVMGGLLSSMTETRKGYNRAQAFAWVQSELDFLRVQGYGIATTTSRLIPDTSNPANDPTTGYLPNYGGGLAEPRIPSGFYQAEIAVTQVTGLPAKEFTVRLYQAQGSPAYTILVTYVSNFNYP